MTISDHDHLETHVFKDNKEGDQPWMQVLTTYTTAMDLMIMAFVFYAQRGKSKENYDLCPYH